jgi:hypothetical protein
VIHWVFPPDPVASSSRISQGTWSFLGGSETPSFRLKKDSKKSRFPFSFQRAPDC